MLQNAIYSVISPEGCATILWRDPKKTLNAAKAMKLSSKELLDLKVIDEIISEPIGGAHRDRNLILKNVKDSIAKNLAEFAKMNGEEIFTHRKNKFLEIGRSKGFVSQLDEINTLSMKKNKINVYIEDILKSKKNILIAILVISIAVYFISLL